MDNKINLLDRLSKKTNVFLFHIERESFYSFFNSTNNKSFLLYLLFLQLSVRKGFCYLRTKEVVDIFNITTRSICNWIKEMNNNGFIAAVYDSKQHFWHIRINTKRHIELWKKFNNGEFDELYNTQISDEAVDSIVSNEENPIQEFENDNAQLEQNPQDLDESDKLSKSINTNENLDKPNESNESNYQNLSAHISANDSNSQLTETIQNDNSNQNSENGGNVMNEIETFKVMSLLDRIENDSKQAQSFFTHFFDKRAKESNKKVLIVTPYKTQIDPTDTTNISYLLKFIKNFEKFERERINNYVGESISPIKEAFKKAQTKIREKNITAPEKVNEIIQSTLNDIDFLDENLLKNVDKVAITIINYNNLKEIVELESKAQALNKEVKFNVISCLNKYETQMRLEQLKNSIDDPYFYMEIPPTSAIAQQNQTQALQAVSNL